jgi:hypothetical protein
LGACLVKIYKLETKTHFSFPAFFLGSAGVG